MSTRQHVSPRWFQRLFDGIGENYQDLIYKEGTIQEVDFMLDVLKLPKAGKILDVGCGPGRHCVEFARRGFKVTGLDYSKRMVEIAKEYAKKEKVDIRFLHGDARKPFFNEEFDAAISICEGAFGLMENDKENIKILHSIFGSLKKNGKLILNILNACFVHRHPEQDEEYDPKTGYGYWVEQIHGKDGTSHELICSNRYFTFPEIKKMLEDVGFKVVNGFGCLSGEFRRKAIELDDFEILVVAKKN